jgi:hypothetical protein
MPVLAFMSSAGTSACQILPQRELGSVFHERALRTSGLLPNRRQPLPWDYFRLARHPEARDWQTLAD